MLFQARHWEQGYAKLLREDEFFKVMLPQATVHRELHSKIHDIPTPNGADCKFSYEQLRMLKTTAPVIADKMKPSKRLRWLVATLGEGNNATKAMLEWQAEFLEKNNYWISPLAGRMSPAF